MTRFSTPTTKLYVRDPNGVYQELTSTEIISTAKSLLDAQFQRGILIDSPILVKDHLKVKLAPLEHEVFYALWLDSKHRIIAEEELFEVQLIVRVYSPAKWSKQH